MTYGPSGALKTLLNGCAPSGSCTQIQETYDYNKRLQAVRLQLGTASNNSANYCLVYNYYSGSTPQAVLSRPRAREQWQREGLSLSGQHDGLLQPHGYLHVR